MAKKLVCLLVLVLSMCMAATAMAETAADTITVADIQKYGNLVLSVSAQDFLDMGYAYGDVVTVTVNGAEYEMPVGSNYADVDSGTTILRVVEADNLVIVAINMGDFATTAGIAEKEKIEADPGYVWHYAVEEPVSLSIALKEAGGYYDEWVIHQLSRSDSREDYPDLTDAEFANFRPVATTGMGVDALYRSSSPVNPELGRNTYADTAAEAAGIRTFINLADNEEVLQSYEGYAESYYSRQNIIALNLGVDLQAADFKAGLAEGFRFIAATDGPYLVHCNEGKDRAGFASAMLECLMGATIDEVAADYMVTYWNYYGVLPGTEQYEAIVNSNIRKSLAAAFGVESIDEADLQAEAVEYLLEAGMTAEEIAAVQAQLAKDWTAADSGVPQMTADVSSVESIDKYGDLILSVTSGEFKAAGFEYADLALVSFLDQELVLPVIPAYRYVAAKGSAIVVWEDDSKAVELEIFNGSFAGNYGLATKTTNEDKSWFWTANDGIEFPVTFCFNIAEKAGYADEYAIFDLARSDSREDYAELDDAQFANFRMITTTGVGAGKLYRSSSPVNPSIGRNTFADAAAAEAGVSSFINLSDSAENAAAYEGYAESYYSQQNVLFLNLGVDFATQANRDGLAEAIRFIGTAEAPFLVHCNEGQDRAGFVSAVLECLMGASWEEVKADYMTTFFNYYGVQEGTEQYEKISNNINKNLRLAFDVEDITAADLQAEAVAYLLEIGCTEQEIAAAQAILGE